MDLTSNFDKNINTLSKALRVGKSFDIIERSIIIGDKKATMYYIDGFVKDDVMELIMSDFFSLSKTEMNLIKSPKDFMRRQIPYVEVAEEVSIDKIVSQVLCGQTALILEGFSSAIMIDLRTYPVRGPQEPETEKVLRGSRDGFVETIVFNTALIRRRIRDPRLTFEMMSIGNVSKTDVVISFLDEVVDKKTLNLIKKKFENLDIQALTMSEQSLVESLSNASWYNPFPKVRYTERPDVAAAHITEGKIVVIIDNSPSVIILPTTIFDFIQDVDDYYLPVITGNFIRLIRNFILISTIFITPLYLLLIQNAYRIPDYLKFLLPVDGYKVPLIVQFLLLEVAVDGLKLASLNTPNALGMSLSVIGGLILGQFAVDTGWFLPQTILYMAIVTLGSFSQPSLELSYALKFWRTLLLILTSLFNVIGFFVGLIIGIVLIASNKTLTGYSYLYPLIPLDWKALKALIFRVRLVPKQKEE
ncbi:spore germination protein [Clostridium perfringens]|uniref:spore germination protein n=1 Tax=Clostridium perfringens TaxID=1502 RepID=UPI00016BD216|nr:spore germination protein [Clostridium perfringens]EDT79059.1 spore germination protein AF [Clostridium perfringens NCTC 8239]